MYKYIQFTDTIMSKYDVLAVVICVLISSLFCVMYVYVLIISVNSVETDDYINTHIFEKTIQKEEKLTNQIL